MKYTYKINKVEKSLNSVYTEEELSKLTTLNLREVCKQENLPVGAVFKLDRSFLIYTILKYRGARRKIFIEEYTDFFSDLLKEATKKLVIQDDKDIEIPTRLTLYKNMDINEYDEYIVKGESLKEGSVLILNQEREVCGVLSLVFNKHKKKFLLHSKENFVQIGLGLHRNYSLGFLSERASQHLYDYYYGYENRLLTMKCRVAPISQLNIVNVENANTSLVIDFGTSNSAAGAYLSEHNVNPEIKWNLIKKDFVLSSINKVKFELDEIIPTVISIKSCVNSKIVYRYGHDALNFSKVYGYNSPATIFFAIKRWINDYNKYEEVSDEAGNTALIPRKDIIKAYFEYIIKQACIQHKCNYKVLHITSPIKQKQQFLKMYEEVLQGYTIIKDAALDEGISVLYNTISNQIERIIKSERDKKFIGIPHKDNYKALVIDCGGGTTDLTKCLYSIQDNKITYELDLTTTYSNGETNFGGNNITYRIFQYLKIVFSEYYTKGNKISLEDIFKIDLHGVYRYIDDNSHFEVYELFEKLYEECENIIPTKYYGFRNSPSEDYMKVRSNFYFIWNLAEKVKVDFFHSFSVSQISFHEYGLKSNLNSKKVLIEEIWRLNIYKDLEKHIFNKNITKYTHELTLHSEVPNVIITKDEITSLIKGDIYNIIKKFIEPLHETREIYDFDIIKLTGQTCKIDIFRDALKEFIPGRVIETSKKDKTIDDFKLTCVEGAIKYQNSKAIGLIAPNFKNNAPITPYQLTATTYKGREEIMISSLGELPQSFGFISKNVDTESVVLTLLDAENKILHNYYVELDVNEFNRTNYEETTSKYSHKIAQRFIDDIVGGEMKIFTYAYEDKWGFYVLPIARIRDDEDPLIGKELYFAFENDEWEANFFDGKK